MSARGESTWKRRVAAGFTRAAADYERAAPVQQAVAAQLAQEIRRRQRLPPRRVLELGCGTGYLTRALLPAWPGAEWWVSDLAPAMVAQCRRRLGDPSGVCWLVMDGERPAVRGPFDLICASLTAQWFQDLPAALAHLAALLAPGGLLALSTMGRDSFAAWRDACRASGVAAGVPAYPDLAGWRRAWPGDGALECLEEQHTLRYRDGLEFLRALRAIGAATPRADYRPLTPGALRRLLRQGSGEAGYHVLYGFYRAEAASVVTSASERSILLEKALG
ncbi:MAG TPA: methyltransferase [Candidatus Competibacteraceae bacterium]|nr:methyltransferase [Candidatus Competibacteraceae bacterium]